MEKIPYENCVKFVQMIDNKELVIKAEDRDQALIVSVSNKSNLKNYPDNLKCYMQQHLIMTQKRLINNVCFNAMVDGNYLICQATARFSKTACNYVSILQWLWELKGLVYSFLMNLENLEQKETRA